MCLVVSLQDLSLVVDDDVGVVDFLRVSLTLSQGVDSTHTEPDIVGQGQLSVFKLRVYFLCELQLTDESDLRGRKFRAEIISSAT